MRKEFFSFGNIAYLAVTTFAVFFLYDTVTDPRHRFIDRATTGNLGGKVPELLWDKLYQMDLETGKVPADLAKLHGKRVKIAGYIVPLTDNYKWLDEFLIVPDGQACIHVPPPPPNLIIQSRMNKPILLDEASNPAIITGIFKIERTESQYGAAGYQMRVESVKGFR